MKTVDLALQTITLHQILEAGFPVVLCYLYASLVAANCLSCVVVILNHARLTAFGEVLLDTLYARALLLEGFRASV